MYKEYKKHFKIAFNFGCITEEKKTRICDIKEPLTQYAKKHRKPIIIKDKQTLKEFKQTVINNLDNISEPQTCSSSSIIFIGIQGVVFQITFLPTNYESIYNEEEDIWT